MHAVTACGGPDAVSNMQWQTIAEAKTKDRWEGGCAGDNCDNDSQMLKAHSPEWPCNIQVKLRIRYVG
jgi:hypothetical protein